MPQEVLTDEDTARDEPTLPVAERSFGRTSRAPRPRVESRGPRAVRELVVDPSDAAAFVEIDDAVAHADDGDRIVVRPGTYRRPVVVDRAVRIEGDGPRERIRLEPIGGEALGIAVSGATITGLTIHPAEAGNDGDDWSAVAVHDATVTIEGCALTSHLGATVWVGGPASRAVLRGCLLDGGSQNAVWIVEEGRAELVACRVTGHRWPMIAQGPHASLSIRDSEVTGNLDAGAVAANGARLVVEGTTVARNAGVGLALADAAPASRIEDCTVEDNLAVGVEVAGGRGAQVLRNRIRRNRLGITIVNAAPLIEGNELADNGIGMGVRGEHCDPVIAANTIVGGVAAGVIVDGGAYGRFQGNSVVGGGDVGVWVDDPGTRPTFLDNHVSACAAVGILVSNGAGGEFRSNDLRGNADGAWQVRDAGELTRIANLEDAGVARPQEAPVRLN